MQSVILVLAALAKLHTCHTPTVLFYTDTHRHTHIHPCAQSPSSSNTICFFYLSSSEPWKELWTYLPFCVNFLFPSLLLNFYFHLSSLILVAYSAKSLNSKRNHTLSILLCLCPLCFTEKTCKNWNMIIIWLLIFFLPIRSWKRSAP